MYERQRKRLLGFRPSQAQSRYRDVYATFEASVEILQASHTVVARTCNAKAPEVYCHQTHRSGRGNSEASSKTKFPFYVIDCKTTLLHSLISSSPLNKG